VNSGKQMRAAVIKALQAAATGSDHHIYYRSLNRVAGVIAAVAISGLDAHPDLTVPEMAENLIVRTESELGPDLLGYGGRPLFPALRKRVAETLIEMGY